MDPEKMGALAFRVVGDMGGAFAMALGYIGDRLGIFRALAGAGPLTSAELAKKTGLNERYVREWAKAMVAAEYIDYQPATQKYVMTEEQAAVLTSEDNPMFVGGAFQFTTPSLYNVPKILQCFEKGGGISYGEIGDEIPAAIERFFRPGYVNFLAKDWIGAVPGLSQRLEKGASICDVGCGCGQSSVVMAKAFPRSTVTAIDYDAGSIGRARKLAAAKEAGNVEFIEGPAHKLPENKFDLVCAFDCIHDMVEPSRTLQAIRASLKPDGIYFWIEPNVSDQPHENRNPVAKLVAGVSPLHCMTVSLAHGGEGLGNQLGEAGARALAKQAGFSRFEKIAIENPFNQFFALHP